MDTTERLHFHFSLSCFGQGNGNPLHCSCLENPRDGGAWRAAVSGVAQSQTRLKCLSSSSSGSSSSRYGYYCFTHYPILFPSSAIWSTYSVPSMLMLCVLISVSDGVTIVLVSQLRHWAQRCPMTRPGCTASQRQGQGSDSVPPDSGGALLPLCPASLCATCFQDVIFYRIKEPRNDSRPG